jgi:hypothetical protein
LAILMSVVIGMTHLAVIVLLFTMMSDLVAVHCTSETVEETMH